MGMVDGKVAIVTGATSGIGTRTVEALIEEGARVVFTGRRAEEGQAIADRLGANAVFVQADATSESDWRRLGETTMERFGRIDCLFNNAGGPAPTGSITSVSVEGFDDAMALLVRSVMLGMKHTAPVMMAQKTGSINFSEISEAGFLIIVRPLRIVGTIVFSVPSACLRTIFVAFVISLFRIVKDVVSVATVIIKVGAGAPTAITPTPRTERPVDRTTHDNHPTTTLGFNTRAR